MTKRGKAFPGVTKAVDQHGKVRWRLRRRYNGRRIDTYINGPYGSDVFRIEYEAALSGPSIKPLSSVPGTVDYLIEHYLASKEWAALRTTTQIGKRARLDWVRLIIGKARFSDLQPRHIANLMDKKNGPNAANRLHKEISQLFSYAERRLGYTGKNPVKTVDRIKVKSDGFHTWSAGEVEIYRNFHPSGSMARLAFELALGTGAARQDVARMGSANLRGGAIVYVRHKTGERVELPLALLPDLGAELALHNRTKAVFVTRKDGKPFTIQGLGNWFRNRVIEASLPDECRLHGLRKWGATRLAERGATEFQIMSFLGHKTPNEARRYVAQANRAVLAADALRMLVNKELPNHIGGLGK